MLLLASYTVYGRGKMLSAVHMPVSTHTPVFWCRGKGFPSLLEASIDSPLSITQGLTTAPSPMATRNLPPVDPVGTDRAPVSGSATTTV